jgi:hypothetical protein
MEGMVANKEKKEVTSFRLSTKYSGTNSKSYLFALK